MAKYIVSRSSDFFQTKKPVEEAVKATVHEYERSNGVEVAVENIVWLCEIEDIHEFARKYGSIIIKKPYNEEGYWYIEIYDSYRE